MKRKRANMGEGEPTLGIKELEEFWKWGIWRDSWSRDGALASELCSEGQGQRRLCLLGQTF